MASTKARLERFVEVELSGSENAELRKLVRSAIEFAQAVKHRRSTVSRTEAAMAADAVILLANLLRRRDAASSGPTGPTISASSSRCSRIATASSQ